MINGMTFYTVHRCKFSERACSICMVFMIGISIAVVASQEGRHGIWGGNIWHLAYWNRYPAVPLAD